MINKTIFSLIAVIFLSSCANKFSLTKRKYTKGYYFASSGNQNSEVKRDNQKTLVVKNLPTKKTTLNSPEIGNEYIKETAAVTFNKPEATKRKNNIQGTEKNHLVTASAKHKKDITIRSVVKALAVNQPLSKGSKKGDADANLILMIILCLFPILALIAIYLHDGKKITLNFWVDLILHILFLYWLFALLVILDVVDLA